MVRQSKLNKRKKARRKLSEVRRVKKAEKRRITKPKKDEEKKK